jgi:hypothetical protein
VIWECPKSFITAESDGLLQQFLSQRRMGRAGLYGMSARQVDAIDVLEKEFARMREHGQPNPRRDT